LVRADTALSVVAFDAVKVLERVPVRVTEGGANLENLMSKNDIKTGIIVGIGIIVTIYALSFVLLFLVGR
jgi:hypothetical protein